MNLTEMLNETNGRVSALETSDLDDAAGVSRIIKLYGGIKISVKIRVRKSMFLTPSSSLYPSNNLFQEVELP